MLEMILTRDVEKLGKAGELVRVKPGYGRNYLLPRGFALLATRGNIAQLDHHRRAIAAEQARIHDKNMEQAKLLKSVSVSIPRKVGQDNKLFGSVTNKDIADALSAQNIELDRRMIRLEHPIKAIGAHKVSVRLSAEVSVDLQVDVIKI